jgi:hypothetical protein
MDISLTDSRDQTPRNETPASRLIRRSVFAVSILLVLAGLIVPAFIPAAVGSIVAAMPTAGERARSAIQAIPGITAVSAPESRIGDLTFRNNVFLTAKAERNLPNSAVDELVYALSHATAEAQGDSRVMVELDLGHISVGISPVAELNPPRVDLARSLARLPNTARTTVLWATHNDDLIIDETNDDLDVWIQAREGREDDLTAAARLLMGHSEHASLSVEIIGDSLPTEHLYSWSPCAGSTC